MRKNSLTTYSVALMIGDFLALVAAFTAAYIIRVKVQDGLALVDNVSAKTYLLIFLTLLPFWLIIFALLGLYRRGIHEKRFSEAGLLLTGSFIGLLFVLGYDFAATDPIFPARLVPVYGFGLAYLLLLIFRNTARSARSYMFRKKIGLTRVVIIGSNEISRSIATSITDPSSGYQIVAFVGDKRKHKNLPTGVKVYGTFNEARLKLEPSALDMIIQTELFSEPSINNIILSYAQTNHKAFRFVPGNAELFVGNIEVELFRSSVPMINVEPTSLLGWGRIAKRAFDVLVSSCLILITLPLTILIWTVIKVSDPRAGAIYKQKRLSRFGKNIHIYKFRSHKKEFSGGLTPEQVFEKMGRPELAVEYRANGDQLPNDPRISRVGAVLRKFSLDEIPQLFNVLKGDISLVGPRALVPEELDEYPKKHLILSVRSGLTGLAQVSGRGDIPFEERRKLDVYYVQNWTFLGDIVILLKTARILVNGKGART